MFKQWLLHKSGLITKILSYLMGLLLTLAGMGEGMSVNQWGPSDLKFVNCMKLGENSTKKKLMLLVSQSRKSIEYCNVETLLSQIC